MPRLRLYDVRLSRLPETVGLCKGDVSGIAAYVNSSEDRLIKCKETGDEGWYGTFAEVAFNGVSRINPFITTPRGIARVEAVNVCNFTVPMNNQFVEYLDFGNGRFPKAWREQCFHGDNLGLCNVFQRNNAVTFTDPTLKAFFIAIYTTNPLDFNSPARIFLQGIDTTDSIVYSMDNGVQVQGVFLPITSPFSQSAIQFSRLTGIQKDVTQGEIQFFQVDPATGIQTLIHTMQPGETVAGYRRYYLNDLPRSCCPFPGTPCVPPLTGTQPLRVTALVKLEPVRVVHDTDYLLLHNMEALIEEAQALRYSMIDSAEATSKEARHHQKAVQFLNGELVHYYGENEPAVNFKPFGSASLERLNIGMM